MSVLPSSLKAALERWGGRRVLGATSMGGGMICRAARVETDDGPVFVKWREDAPSAFFEDEQDGLRRLAAAGALRVPEVLGFHEPGRTDWGRTPWEGPHPPAYLALEYVEARPPADPERFARRFGEALARQHRKAVAPDGRFGLDTSNYIGLLPQDNAPRDHWPAFWRDCRLLPQVGIARAKGLLPPGRERLLMRLLERIEALLDDMPARPVLLHGDLWSGNLLSAGEEPVVIDPAVYYGDREAELAYMELFSGFPPAALAAYRAAYPLDPGYLRRRALHQLYPLLVHLNHFGEQYGSDVEAACRT